MIVVTGATGHLGRAVVEALLNRVPAARVVASARDPDKASVLANQGVTVRHGDFDDPDGLQVTFEGASQVLIVSADKLGDEGVQLHRNAIDAARQAGVQRLLYTSHMGARPDSPFAAAWQHASTEDELAASGLAFTSLRHGFYAESCLLMIGDALKAGELRVPEDGPVSWTARDDLASGDAAVLAGDGQLDGISPALTASAALTMADIAAMASEIMDREVRHVTVSDDDWRAAKVAAGMPEPYAELLLGSFQASRRGDFAATDPALERLIGRVPQSMHDVLAKFLRTI